MLEPCQSPQPASSPLVESNSMSTSRLIPTDFGVWGNGCCIGSTEKEGQKAGDDRLSRTWDQTEFIDNFLEHAEQLHREPVTPVNNKRRWCHVTACESPNLETPAQNAGSKTASEYPASSNHKTTWPPCRSNKRKRTTETITLHSHLQNQRHPHLRQHRSPEKNQELTCVEHNAIVAPLTAHPHRASDVETTVKSEAIGHLSSSFASTSISHCTDLLHNSTASTMQGLIYKNASDKREYGSLISWSLSPETLATYDNMYGEMSFSSTDKPEAPPISVKDPSNCGEQFDMKRCIATFERFLDDQNGDHIFSWGLQRFQSELGFESVFHVRKRKKI